MVDANQLQRPNATKIPTALPNTMHLQRLPISNGKQNTRPFPNRSHKTKFIKKTTPN